jgi:DNA-binding NarL/FixJ family response regulator
MSTSTRPIRAGLIEDDPVMRAYLKALLTKQEELESVDVWESAEAFFADPCHQGLGWLLVDLELPGDSGIEVIMRMRAEQPQTACIVLTASSDPKNVFQAINAGASGYLVKEARAEMLLQNLQDAVKDGMTFSPSIARLVVNAFLKAEAAAPSEPQVSSLEKLTEREREVLEQVQRLGNAKDVASSLGLSHETVRVHLKKIYQKLHVGSKTAAVALLAKSRNDMAL